MAPRRLAGSAFTLLEMLVVVAIMGVIAAVTIPAANSMMRGSALTQAAQMVSANLSLARQTALSTGHSVEVRIYQFADSSVPGETVGVPASGKYRGMQAFEITDSGTVPVGKVQLLPNAVMIDSGTESTTLSSIISGASASGTVPTLTTGTAINAMGGSGAVIPRANLAYNAVSFRFLADGSTNFTNSNAQWFLTVENTNSPWTSSNLPANFVTIQLNAANGHITTFQP